MDLHELQLPEHHRETLSRFVAACQADDRIVAAFLGGSYASHEADRFSDLDLFFITTDESYGDFLVERQSFLRQLGEPLILDDFGAPHGYCFILSNTTEGEVWFGHESKFKDIYSGPYIVLLDKRKLLDGEAFPPPIADQVQQLELLQRQLDGFWHELSHFIKAMGRKQLWFAYGQIEAMRRQCVVLARLKHNFADPYADEHEPYFKIEQAFPVETLAPLQTTFCRLEYSAVLEAGLVIARFYQAVAPGLAKIHHLSYQADLDRVQIGELQELSRASRAR